MTVRSTSPANTLPKSLNENEISLAISEINSRMPTKKSIGLLRVKNLPACFTAPIEATPKKDTEKTAKSASAKVKFRSLAGERRSGAVKVLLSWTTVKTSEPTTGRSPSQLETSTKKNTVAISGKYFSVFSRL